MFYTQDIMSMGFWRRLTFTELLDLTTVFFPVEADPLYHYWLYYWVNELCRKKL